MHEIDALHLFSTNELAHALQFITRDTEASRYYALEVSAAVSRSVHGPDDALFTLLAFVSDDCAERVGRVRGQTRSEVLAWRASFEAENGHPSTWEVTRVDDEEEDGGEALDRSSNPAGEPDP